MEINWFMELFFGENFVAAVGFCRFEIGLSVNLGFLAALERTGFCRFEIGLSVNLGFLPSVERTGFIFWGEWSDARRKRLASLH